MTRYTRIRTLALGLAVTAAVTDAGAQGKGKGGGQGADKGKGPQGSAQVDKPGRDHGDHDVSRGAGKARGGPKVKDRADDGTVRGPGSSGRARGNPDRNRSDDVSGTGPNPSARAYERASPNARFRRNLSLSDVRPSVRRHINSSRPAEFLAGGALAYALTRGLSDNTLVLAPVGQEFLLRNRAGRVLLGLDDDAARNLGRWQVDPLADNVGEGAPSFCRSGAGHPNWGRQWCVDKGFGLGTAQDVRWGRTNDLRDIVFSPTMSSATLSRDDLLGVLGAVAFNRLALHAVTLGYSDPLTGRWQRETETGPAVLLVSSGARPVAEMVDVNGDRRADMMLVALRQW